MGRLYKTAVAAISMLLMALMLQAAPAAAAGCYGSSCNGQDPNAMGCGGYTVREFTFNGARYEMRYSSACRAVWTRSTAYSGFDPNTYRGIINKYWCTAASASCRYGTYSVQTTYGVRWTAMMSVSGGVRYRTCMSYHGNTVPDYCTSPFVG